MKAAYLVTENDEYAHLLEQILPAEILQQTEVISSRQKYSARSLAGTVMSVRKRPVLLLVDADSDNPLQAKEREQTLEYMLLPAATAEPYKVCAVIPSLAALTHGAHKLSSEQIHDLQQHPLIQQVIEFFESSISQAA